MQKLAKILIEIMLCVCSWYVELNRQWQSAQKKLTLFNG